MSEFEHITYCVDESANDTIIDVESFLTDFEKSNNYSNENLMFVEMKDYDLNYSVKQLLLICEYYNISKGAMRLNKMKKQDIIEQIILFEHDSENFDAVQKRKQMWFYINELREDKFMKKYILWPSS
jgi:hypothetical protein